MGCRQSLWLAIAISLASSSIRSCLAVNGASAYQWKFTGSSISTTLSQCQSYPLLVENRTLTNGSTSGLGAPPYYMIAFIPKGIPVLSYIGSDPNNLSWTANAPVGTNVLLGVTDSNGDAGGEPPSLYTIGPGSTSSCLPGPSPVNITIVANVTGSVETCEPMGFRIYGGKKPYNISLVAPNSPVVTNLTMGPTDDIFTYVDRADPQSNLMVAVCDADGVWGTSSELFKTTGSTNTSCVGLVSSSGNSSVINEHPKPPSKGHAATIAVAVVVPVVVILLIVVVMGLIWRRKRLEALREPEPAFLPEAWIGPGRGADGGDASATPDSKVARYRSEMASAAGMSGASFQSPASVVGGSSSSGSGGVYPLSPVRSLSTSKGGVRTHQNLVYSGLPTSDPSLISGQRRPPGVPANWEVEPNIVIQHEDAGAVQEIPPPYIDRGNSGQGSGNAEAGPSNTQGS